VRMGFAFFLVYLALGRLARQHPFFMLISPLLSRSKRACSAAGRASIRRAAH